MVDVLVRFLLIIIIATFNDDNKAHFFIRQNCFWCMVESVRYHWCVSVLDC